MSRKVGDRKANPAKTAEVQPDNGETETFGQAEVRKTLLKASKVQWEYGKYLAETQAGFTNHIHPAILPVSKVDFFCSFWWAVCLRKIVRLRLIPREQVSEGLLIIMTLTANGG